MRKLIICIMSFISSFLTLVVVFCVILLLCLTGCTNQKQIVSAESTSTEQTTSITTIEGTWKCSGAIFNEKVYTVDDLKDLDENVYNSMNGLVLTFDGTTMTLLQNNSVIGSTGYTAVDGKDCAWVDETGVEYDLSDNTLMVPQSNTTIMFSSIS